MTDTNTRYYTIRPFVYALLPTIRTIRIHPGITFDRNREVAEVCPPTVLRRTTGEMV